MLGELAARASRDFDGASSAIPGSKVSTPTGAAATVNCRAARSEHGGGVEEIEGKDLTLLFDSRKCIHSRFCVTWAPKVFLANVQGPWIHPDAMEVERLVEIAHVCPSGAIRYRRKDGKANEAAPLVNLITIRENGPYAVRADMQLNGQRGVFRATLCRCGASKNKPFCDGSHNEVEFRRVRRASLGENRHARRSRRRTRHRARDRWSAARPRQSRDHLRHWPGCGARYAGPLVSLWRQRQQTILRRHARAHRVSVDQCVSVAFRQLHGSNFRFQPL